VEPRTESRLEVKLRVCPFCWKVRVSVESGPRWEISAMWWAESDGGADKREKRIPHIADSVGYSDHFWVAVAVRRPGVSEG
jgi:hypothetical protein